VASIEGARRFRGAENTQWTFPSIDTYIESERKPNSPPPAPKAVRRGFIAVLGAIGLAVVVGTGSIVWSSMSGPGEQVVSGISVEPTQDLASVSPRELVIHISGEVTSPGIITLPEGSRVIDAVEMAGGHTSAAELESINLARLIIDGEHLIIPAVGEAGPDSARVGEWMSLSLASEQQLQELPGVGPAIASRIVAWREKNGPFRHVDDLLAVSGIGPATLEKFRDRVSP
jgi:competence protein ComEA